MKQKQMSFWLATLVVITFTFSLLFLNAAPASSHETIAQTFEPSWASFLQATATPTPTVPITQAATFPLTLSDLGYSEVTINSPLGKTDYSFKLPNNWQLQESSFIEFDLSYNYSSRDTSADLPATFGELTITIDGQTVEVFTIGQPVLDHYRLRIPMPSFLFDASSRTGHLVGLSFNAGSICTIPHQAVLVVHPTSFFSLNYTQSPIVPDLASYPLPFFQSAFEPDRVVFGLPAQPSQSEAVGAVSMAAKLGNLTRNRMVISTTFDLELVDLLASPSATFEPHLFVIGQPQHNRLLSLLNQVADLPVKLEERQMELSTQGPAHISSDQTFTYTFTVTNTTNQTANLSLIDPLPMSTKFADCQPECMNDAIAHVITWANTPLAPGEVENFRLTLKVTDILTGSSLENTVTLMETELGPINADTFVSEVELDSVNPSLQQTSAVQKSDYFFTRQGQAVSEYDGIVQEITSPWNANRAILIVTGLNDEAIRKASQAMSAETHFPGMTGVVALVQDALPPEIDTTPSTLSEMTLQDLGYSDELVGGGLSQKINYAFFVPLDWKLTDEAAIELYFNHSQVLDPSSSLNISFNNTPVATIALNKETAANGQVRANLPASAAKAGAINRLNVEVIPVAEAQAGCSADQLNNFWFLAKNSSKISLAHRQNAGTTLALDLYPYPFTDHPSLVNLLFALPDSPTADEWEQTLRLAASIGNSAEGRTMLPAVIRGADLSAEELANYHIIAIGRPSRNAMIQQVNAELPQPFLPNSDEIQQQIDNVVFRLLPGAQLGYLQLIPSPWNAERTLLAVTGTTDESVAWAVRILSSGRSLQLGGNLSLIRDTTIDNIDTRKLLKESLAMVIATAVPEMAGEAVITSTAIASANLNPMPAISPTEAPRIVQPQVRARPLWLIPLVAITVIIVLAIFIIAFMQAQQRRRKHV